MAAPALALAGEQRLARRDSFSPEGRLATGWPPAAGESSAAMASWGISRQPIRQGGAALLIVLAVATGTLALSQRQSWTRSVHDQAAFSTGADVRVQTSQPLLAAQAGALARAPGIRQAMPVAPFEQTATDGVYAGGGLRAGRGRDAAQARPVAGARCWAVRQDPARRPATGRHPAGPGLPVPLHRPARPRRAAPGRGRRDRLDRGRGQRRLPGPRPLAARRRPRPGR